MSIRQFRRSGAIAGVGICLTLALSGCGLGKDLYNTPLPGGADVGSNPVTITADFDDVVDLVPQSSVKVENIAVGRVASIELNPDGRSAKAKLVLRRDVDLPAGTTARLQQTSLLGEKYVALVRPTETVAGTSSLKSGANIPVKDTSQVAEVEQVLGALSLVINGGGIAKFQDISRELQQVSTGRPEEIRGFLRNMRVFMTSLDSRKGAITDALDSLATLSTTLDHDKAKIATALAGLSPGMKVLSEQRPQLVKMLTSLEQLSTVSVRTLNASQKEMTEDLQLLEPILHELAASGDALPNSLELLLTYPFPDSVLGAIKGDYLNVFTTANYTSLPDSCAGFGCPWPQLPDNGNLPPWSAGDPIPGAGRTALVPTGKPSSGTSSASSDTQSLNPSGSSSGSPSPSPTGSPTGSPSPSASASPSLLPPTNSALPGLAQPSVQVPSATPSSASRKAR